jgi:fermentation-respiration switch protein FrsA (DUF1100 family)
VKEQTSGLYAQTLAERGFVTVAWDPSYNGERGGTRLAHFIASPEPFVEDFSAVIDYIGLHPKVDRDRIGALGICGSGGFAIAAAQSDPRIKAVATVSMYDMGRDRRQHLGDTRVRAACHGGRAPFVVPLMGRPRSYATVVVDRPNWPV